MAIKVGDIFWWPSFNNGFMVIEEITLYDNKRGITLSWSDHRGISQTTKKIISELVKNGTIYKISDKDAFVYKLKYSENFNGN